MESFNRNHQRILPLLVCLGLLLLALNFPLPAWAMNSVFPKTRGNLGNDVLYYIVVDRFLDAEPGNDIPDFAFETSPELEGSNQQLYNDMNKLLLRHTYDPTHRFMGMYWGGDLEGVIEKLDYLADLGVTKIILSPIQDNANGLFYHPDIKNYLYLSKTDSIEDDFYRHISTAYHGYWTKDWFEIDEHLRNPQDEKIDRYQVFRRLLNEAGERGIGVILDLTMNQTSPGHISTEPPALGAGGFLFGESWFADNGNVYRHGKLVATHWDPKTGERDPQGWFHSSEIIWDFDTASQTLLEEGQISGGMPDLNQDVPEVEKYFLDAAQFWLTFNAENYPIAGFRLDAVKHVNVRFWRKFEDLVLSINPDAVLVGEYFSGGYRCQPSIQFLNQTEFITQFDFNFSEAARRFFAHDRGWDGRTYILRETVLGREGDYYNASPWERLWHWVFNPAETLEVPRQALEDIPDEEAQGWVTFVENHDQPRVRSFYPHMSDRAYASLVKFQFASRGVPLVMYGTETGLGVPYHPEHQGLFGIGGDPFNRPMMIWPNSLGWKPEIYNATRSMAHLRQQCPALRYGSTRFLSPKNANSKDDIFMLREAQNSNSDCPRILYAYSTQGGKFLLSFAEEGVNQVEIVETGQKVGIIDGLVPIQLQPEESKVLVLMN
jgi:glycosidase